MLVAGVVAAVAVTGAWVWLGSRGSTAGSASAQPAREFSDSLIYVGIGLFQKKDYPGAISAWQRYISTAPPNADTVSIREMIEEAESAAMKSPKPRVRRMRSVRVRPGLHPKVLQRVSRSRSIDATGTTAGRE